MGGIVFSTEAEQVVIYRQTLEEVSRQASNRVVRGNIGGDKSRYLISLSMSKTFLGWRGIRVTPRIIWNFHAKFRPLKKPVPIFITEDHAAMISNVAEVEEALALIRRGYAEVKKKKYNS